MTENVASLVYVLNIVTRQLWYGIKW